MPVDGEDWQARAQEWRDAAKKRDDEWKTMQQRHESEWKNLQDENDKKKTETTKKAEKVDETAEIKLEQMREQTRKLHAEREKAESVRKVAKEEEVKKRKEAREKIEQEFKDWQAQEEDKAAQRQKEADGLKKQREAREKAARDRQTSEAATREKAREKAARERASESSKRAPPPAASTGYTRTSTGSSNYSFNSGTSTSAGSGPGLYDRVRQGASAQATRNKPPSPTASQLGDPNQLWEKFVAASKNKEMVNERDIPFPTKSSLSNMKFSDQKSLDSNFKKLAMRWHPDKFMQKYGKKLNPKDKESIESRVKEVFQMMNSARNPSPEKGGGGYGGYSGGYGGSSGYRASGYVKSNYTSGTGFGGGFGGSNRYTSNFSRYR